MFPLFAFALQITDSNPNLRADVQSALNACDRERFETAVVLESSQITNENASIVEEIRRIVEGRQQIRDRRERRRRNGPLAGIFNADTNEVEIAETERDLEERQALTLDRRRLLEMRRELLRSQINIYQLSCRAENNAQNP